MTNPDLAALSAAATCTLADCPPGLFWCGDTLGFKSEYTTTLENPRRYQCDAYVVASGEYFHGGARNTAERAALIVRPVSAGRLVQIDEGMRERVARAIDHELMWSVETDVLAASLTREEQLKVADAAIAAMKGGAK